MPHAVTRISRALSAERVCVRRHTKPSSTTSAAAMSQGSGVPPTSAPVMPTYATLAAAGQKLLGAGTTREL
jgi:hypothetical protein